MKLLKIAFGTIAGVAAGFAAGVLLAPRSGAESRAMASDAMNDAWDSAVDTYERGQQVVADKGAIFDMDGLMFDTEKLVYENWLEMMTRRGFEYNLDIYKKTVGKRKAEVEAVVIEAEEPATEEPAAEDEAEAEEAEEE